ncbi:uncharacterized protein HKW66_Vig0182540 [Vigna angularis]|uniref:Neprosin PEP catalytic domain-containing protein n=2 Tax=Phaseolus angularis TaxID=3914 RepID=A0A8T0K4D2_PHAAN|nr:uncharacterized protein HKW66_Vig0182540 [Vigna angularis]
MNSANEVGWGGRTRTAIGTLSPEMGSGHLPDGNISHSGYFSEMFIADAKGKPYAPKLSEAHSFTDKPNCFGVKYFGFVGPKYGNLLQFGGPGGTCGN